MEEAWLGTWFADKVQVGVWTKEHRAEGFERRGWQIAVPALDEDTFIAGGLESEDFAGTPIDTDHDRVNA